MPRRITKAESTAIIFLVLIGLIVSGIAKIFETTGILVPVVIVLICIGRDL